MPDKSDKSDKDDITYYRKRLEALEDERRGWVDHWQDITDYILPRKGEYLSVGTEPNKGSKKHSKIIDPTASFALRVLAAGMQGGLTSPARPWFRLRLGDEAMMEYGPVRIWLNAVERSMYEVFNQSNFYTIIHSTYYELGGFGTACMMAMEDFDKVVHFRSMTAGEYSIATNAKRIVDTVYRRFFMTVDQLVEKFGYDNVSQPVRTRYDEQMYDEWVQVVHAVEPNTGRDDRRADNANFAFKSCYFEHSNKNDRVNDGFLSKGGFQEFPYMVPRWDVTGSEIYGRSPGMDVLGHVKMLQDIQKSQMKAVHKTLDPPLRVPSSFQGKLINLPGGINIVDVNDDKAIGPLYNINFDIANTNIKIDDMRLQIRDGLFNDLFLMLIDTPVEKTATEIAARQEEKLLMLGPVIERQFFELLDPTIDRTFGIMNRFGMFPPPPQEMQGMPMDIEYISLLAQAQKLIGTQSLNAFTGYVANLATLKPDVLDKVDMDEAIDQYADMTGVPATVVRSDDQVAILRQQRAEMLEQQRQQEMTMQQIQGTKTLSEIDTEGKNALTDLQQTLEP